MRSANNPSIYPPSLANLIFAFNQIHPRSAPPEIFIFQSHFCVFFLFLCLFCGGVCRLDKNQGAVNFSLADVGHLLIYTATIQPSVFAILIDWELSFQFAAFVGCLQIMKWSWNFNQINSRTVASLPFIPSPYLETLNHIRTKPSNFPESKTSPSAAAAPKNNHSINCLSMCSSNLKQNKPLPNTALYDYLNRQFGARFSLTIAEGGRGCGANDDDEEIRYTRTKETEPSEGAKQIDCH